MKKTISLILAALMLFAFAACGKNEPDVITKRPEGTTASLTTDNSTVTEPVETSVKVYKDVSNETSLKHDHTLTLSEGNSFELELNFMRRCGMTDCEKIGVDYEENVTMTSSYILKGSYTVKEDGVLTPNVTTVLYYQTYITEAGENLAEKVRVLLDSDHEAGKVDDSTYEIFVQIMDGKWGDITDQFTSEFTEFRIDDENMTFEYTANGF